MKLPVTLQTDEVREQLAKPDLGEAATDDDMLLHTAHCCTLSHNQTSVLKQLKKLLQHHSKTKNQQVHWLAYQSGYQTCARAWMIQLSLNIHQFKQLDL